MPAVEIDLGDHNKANVKTAQVWHASLLYDKTETMTLFKEWLLKSKLLKVIFLNKVIATFERQKKE